MDKITIPKADVGYNITLTATDSAGVAKDCSTYTTYKLQVWKPGLDPDVAANLTIDSAFSWTSAAGGTGYYTIATGNFATAGLYHARIFLSKTGVEEKLSTFAIVVADPTLYVTVDEVRVSWVSRLTPQMILSSPCARTPLISWIITAGGPLP